MRLSWLAVALSGLLCAPAAAQEPGEPRGEEPGEPRGEEQGDAAEASPTPDHEDALYEPDQRGEVDPPPDPDGTPADTLYEPDQRGGLDDERRVREEEVRYTLDAGTDAGAAPADESLAEGRAVRLYIDLFTGYSFLNPAALDDEGLLPRQHVGEDGETRTLELRRHGATFGIGVGAALRSLSIGVRADLAVHSDGLRLGRVGGEIGLTLPAGERLAPRLRLGAGVALLGGEDYVHPRRGDSDVAGPYVGLGVGVLGRVSDRLSLGGGVDFDLLMLDRDPVDPPCATPEGCRVGDVDLGAAGSSTGLRMGFHVEVRLEL